MERMEMETPEIWDKEPDLDALTRACDLMTTNPTRALAEFRALEARGSIISLVNIGHIFEYGRGAPVDLAKAEEYYQRAHEGGSTSGLFYLGAICWKAKDYKRAEKLFEIGAKRNDPRSMYWLACAFLRNPDQSDRYERAAVLLERAYSMGHLQSQRKLGKLLISGRLGILSIPSGFRHYVRAAIIGSRLAVDDPTNERLRDLPIDSPRSRRSPESTTSPAG